MTWVKVCGMRTRADVAAAVAAGADAVGFVAIPSSPRHIPVAQAAVLAEGVPIETVLLVVDAEPDWAVDVLHSTAISAIQPYGEHRHELASAAAAAGYRVLFPVRAEPGLQLAPLPGMPLVDTPAGDQLGGTGRVFDWEIAAALDGDFVLAGGLSPHNVAAAIAATAPWGVDASSGLEREPGVKDHGMVADFITKAKTT